MSHIALMRSVAGRDAVRGHPSYRLAAQHLMPHASEHTLALNSPGSEGMPSRSAASVMLMPRSASAANAVAAAAALSLAPAPKESCRCHGHVSGPGMSVSVNIETRVIVTVASGPGTVCWRGRHHHTDTS